MKCICNRITALLLVLLMTASLLASCSGKTEEPPTEEEVFAALSQASNEAIDLMNVDDKLGSIHGYFFNETCSMTLLDGKMTYDTDGVPHYTTTVESKNAWKYVDVVETERLDFTYNPDSAEWELVDYVIESVTANWHLDSEYQGEDGIFFQLQMGDYVSGGSDINYEGFDFIYSNYTEAVFTLTNEKGEVYIDDMVRLYTPCSKGIRTGGGSFSTDEKDSRSPIEVILRVELDKIFYVDRMAPIYEKITLS
ncbi:MAG: hypothetical protein E7428_08255 [Ruminococcaceae bacterium]|nr:hypothetical protein [Oscillospiraceae bacterium]